MKRLIMLGGAAAVMLAAAPADAHYRHGHMCARWHHGHCVRWMNHGYAVSMARHGGYRVGHVFGPSYSYTEYSALPQPIVTRYHLSPDYRYVYTGNTVYVVDPTSYAITRILNAISR